MCIVELLITVVVHIFFLFLFLYYLNNYFVIHVWLSFHPPSILRPSVRPFICPSVGTLTPGSAVGSQNDTNKSFLVCVKSEQYAFWVTLRPLGFMRQGKAKIQALWYFARQSQSASIKTHFSVSLPPQCWSQALVCIGKPRMYPQSR